MRYAYTNKFIVFFAKLIDAFGFFIFPKQKKDLIAPKSILVIKLDHLGDCFLMAPLLENLKEKFPDANIDILCQESSEPIFRENPSVRNVFCFNYQRFHRGNNPEGLVSLLVFVWRNRKKYDMAIDARGEPIAALISFLIGAKQRIGFGEEEVGSFLYTTMVSWNREEPEWKKYSHILELIGLCVDVWNPEIFLTEEEVKEIRGFIPQTDFLIVGIGSGAEYKKYPIESYIRVFKEVIRKKPISVFVLGGPNEKKDGDRFVFEIGKYAHNYAGAHDIRISYGIVQRSKGYIGNDSVLAHFAGSFNLPVLELMSCVNNEKRWRAGGERTKTIVGCSSDHSCLVDSCVYCPHMASIKEDEVLRFVLEMI